MFCFVGGLFLVLFFFFPEGNFCSCFKHCKKPLLVVQNHCIKIPRGRNIAVILSVHRYLCKICKWVHVHVLFCDLLTCFRSPVIYRCLGDDRKYGTMFYRDLICGLEATDISNLFEICFELFCRLTSFLEKLFQIVSLIESNSVVIIQGATGSGKSTQIPQYILDHCIQQSVYCNIAVTQPRKIGASSIARWISKERSWTLGGFVGYQV